MTAPQFSPDQLLREAQSVTVGGSNLHQDHRTTVDPEQKRLGEPFSTEPSSAALAHDHDGSVDSISEGATATPRAQIPSAPSDSTSTDPIISASPQKSTGSVEPISQESCGHPPSCHASRTLRDQPASQGVIVTQASSAGGPTSEGASIRAKNQTSSAPSVLISTEPKRVSPNQESCGSVDSTPVSHAVSDTQDDAAGGPTSGSIDHAEDHDLPDPEPTYAVAPGSLRDPFLGVCAEVVDDLEKVRVANSNRIRILTRTEADKDGEERGFGLTVDHPEVAKLVATMKLVEAAEKDAIKNLEKSLRKTVFAEYQKREKGIGAKQLSRLLAAIGDPFWNDLHGRPRTVDELWAYCGLDVRNGVAPRRMKGQKSNWSETARKRAWVMASAMPKFPGGRYEALYREGRVKYAEATHSVECSRCGPKGKPALVGSPLSAGHQNARAIRLVSKEILKDLYREARAVYRPDLAAG